MKRLLVGLDGSAVAEASLPYAVTLARASGASITLMQVVVDDDGPPIQDVESSLLPFVTAYPTSNPQAESVAQRAQRHEAVAYLDGVAERLGRIGIVAEIAVVVGPPGDVLVDEAAARQVDLVMIATHGRSGLGRWVFGSIAETVLAHSLVPVLVVRAWSPPHPLVPPARRPSIVVPLDGSPLAESALPRAKELARLLDGEICLVRAIPLPYMAPSLEEEMGPVYSLEVHDALEEEARAYVASIAQRLRAAEIGVDCTVGFGSPAGEILATARERGAGLIVMATQERTGLSRTLLGSVALEVLHRGDLPVLFVRGTPPAHAG